MKLLLIGIGQAGGKVVDRFLAYERRTGSDFVVGAVAFNTARADLRGLEHVPEANRHLFGQAEVKGHGVGADNELAASLAEQDSRELLGAIDDIPTSRAEAILVVGALGGGTGSGAAPVLARHLGRIYTQPIYGLGILPGRDEGSVYSLNAARSFQTFVGEVDNLLVFDNDAWATSGETVGDAYEEMNDELVRRLGLLFAAGEASGREHVGESVVDSSEILNTLDGGGVTTVGYAASELDGDGGSDGGLLSSLLGRSEPDVDPTESIQRLTTATRRATRGRLTLPCDVSSTERALVVVSGPPAWLSRKGMERARRWLEDETACMEVRGGDYPLPESGHVAVDVVCSGVTDVPRIKQLQQVAVEASDRTAELDAQDSLGSLVDDGKTDELDSLF